MQLMSRALIATYIPVALDLELAVDGVERARVLGLFSVNFALDERDVVRDVVFSRM